MLLHTLNLLAHLSAVFAVACLSLFPLYYFQLGSYQFRAYIRTLIRQKNHIFTYGALLLPASLMAFLLPNAFRNTAVRAVLFLLGAVLIVLSAILVERFSRTKREHKNHLRFTKRMKRLLAAEVGLLMALYGTLLALKLPLLAAVLTAPIPVYVLFSALLIWPVERAVYEYYFQRAKKRLKQQKDLILIGITGSYGKTSTKAFLDTILSQKYHVLSSPRSANTPMALSTVILENLSPGHQVLIAEMGARHRGDIKELCRMIHPAIAVLTSVGPQHLETFGSIETVKQAKYDLIRALDGDGQAVFVRDHGIVDTLYEQTRGSKGIVGDPGDEAWAEDVRLSDGATAFILCLGGERIPLSTHVTGSHNLKNILAAAAVAKRLGLTSRQIAHGIEMLSPVASRFQVEKRPDGVTYINNGFNSNPESSQKALDALSLYHGRRIVVTPGFIELGQQEKEFNKELGVKIASVADVVFLVGPVHTAPVLEGLVSKGFGRDAVHVVKTLKEANAGIDRMKQAGDIVLYENDLPDHYSEL